MHPRRNDAIPEVDAQGTMILGTASDGEYRTEITVRLRNARMNVGLTESDKCAKPWLRARRNLMKLLKLCSPGLLGKTSSNPSPLRECVYPGMLVGSMLCRYFSDRRWLSSSDRRWLSQYLAIAPSKAKAVGVRAMETLGIVEAARDAQRRLRLMGLSKDEKRDAERR